MAERDRRRQQTTEAIAMLEDLYRRLPDLQCRGMCADSCNSHVDASTIERRRILEAGVDLDAPTSDGACPALSKALGVGRCTVYTIRPAICRLWGSSASMQCPHGCRPSGGFLDDAAAMRWLMDTLDAGGHSDRLGSAEVRALMEVALADSTAAGLLSRFLRGDRTVSSELADRLRRLRAANS